ncbi:MAG: hypothetical protein IKQ00_13090 [Butyrivibrio sp.]|nr:hypothetical protein [Butyrivibrio sp.]MBR4640057.1 hypothetical protein [Butyrivibrio sp.]
MTSANSSWVDKVKANKNIMSNKSLWSYILVAPVMFIAFIVPMVLWFIRSHHYGIEHEQDAAQLLFEKQSVVMHALGLGSMFYVLIGALGIIYAFTKFSYLFSMSKLDFYLSLPTTSARRIQSAYMVAVNNFIAIFLAVEAVAVLIAAAFGAINTALIIAILIQTVRMIIFFYTCFTITTLAILLCGTRMIALVLTAIMLYFPYILGEEFHYLNRMFFSTASELSENTAVLSPCNDVQSVANIIMHKFRFYSVDKVFDVSSVMNTYLQTVRYDIDMIVTAVIATVLVVFVYKHRRAEHVGKTVIFRPVRWACKVLVCVIASLGGMVVIRSIFNSAWSRKLYIILCIGMLAICVFVGSLIEICLDSDIKSFAKGKRQTLMAMAILLLIFFIYKGDLLGYDSYVPSASSVESAALFNNDFGIMYDDRYYYSYDSRSDWSSYSFANMKITDMDAFIPVAQKGMECARKSEGGHYNCGWEEKILYNLKDGRRVYRDIIIPYDIDPKLMDKLTGSEEFIKGHTPCFSEKIFTTENLAFVNASLVCRFPGGDERTNNVSVIVDIMEAYKQDVLEKYKFSYIKDTSAIGDLFISCEPAMSCTLPVYEDFTHVIDVLKKNDLFTGKDFPVDNIQELSVDNNFPGYNFGEMSDAETMEIYNKWYYSAKDFGFDSKIYTDKDKIKEIMENCVYENYPEWNYPFNKVDKQFNVHFDDKFMDAFTHHFSFKRGSVPKFVYEDFNK